MKKNGFSLIELLIAMAVLITMLLSLETLYVNTLRVTQKTKMKNQAQSLARKTMEEYKSIDFEKLKAINGDVTDGQINQVPGTNFNRQISVDFVDQDWADEDNDGDQNELVKTDNETNIMKLRVVISDRKQPKRIDDTVLETLISEGGHTNLPQFKITANPEITNEGNVTITIRSSEALDPDAALGNPLNVTILFANGTNSGNIYTSGGFNPSGTNQWTGTFTVFDSTVDGNATITVRGRSMPGQPIGLWGIEKEGILIDTYNPTYRDLIPLTGSSLSNRKPLISVIFKDEGDTSYTPIPKPSLLDTESLSITINGNDEELANVSKITQAEDPGLSEYELKINYVPTVDLLDGNYTVDITISDLAGNATTASASFTIAGATVPDNVQPAIYPMLPINLVTGQISTDPASPAIIIDLKPTISANIEDLPAGGASGIDPSSIVLTLDGTVTHTYSVSQVSWTPPSDLSLDRVYEVTLNLNDNGVDFTDNSGTGPPDGDKYDTAVDGVWEHPNSADEAKWYFKITTHPIVTAVYPPNGESPNSKIIVTFNKEMDVQSIKDSLSIIGSVSGDRTSLVLSQDAVWSSLNKTITFNDNNANILQNNETYTITINNTAKDIDGINLEIAYSWTISTPDTMPPVFWHHDHNPPQDGQIRNTAVVIRVRVQDNIALPQNKAYLYYRNKIGSGFDEWSSWYNIVMTFLSWNETNKDAEFSAVIDQSYVTIPEGLFEGMIQYYFKAEDAAVNGSYFDASSDDSSWVSEPTSFYGFTIVSPNFIFFDDFEGNKKGWTHNGTKDDWQVNIPRGKGGGYYRGNPDPTSAHSGTKCYGNDLTGIGANPGDYEHNAVNYLTSPEINCTGKTNVHLTFYRWLNVDRNSNDKAYIVVSSGIKWDTAFSNSDTTTITDSLWTPQAINISSWADGKKKVRIRFGLTSNGSVNYSGWNIDDVTIKEGE